MAGKFFAGTHITASTTGSLIGSTVFSQYSILSVPHLVAPFSVTGKSMRKLIAFDDDTFDKLKQLSRDRMGTFQELADEAFADLLKKHGIPIDLKDALRRSARQESARKPTGKNSNTKASRKAKP